MSAASVYQPSSYRNGSILPAAAAGTEAQLTGAEAARILLGKCPGRILFK